jgi:peptidoglycan/LPS O-acetylase OafA/YrhL
VSVTSRLDFSLKYRADIDGLRAVAVVSVVVYHLGMPLHGGYVGVDIFFTISGFLIGSIILRGTSDRRFSFAGFYERRIRRLFPALFVVLIVSAILAFKYLLPVELVAFSESLAAVSLSLSNVFFWLQSGYFEAQANETPLLHTWTLAVEEQFYIFLPVLLVLLHRLAPRRISLVIYFCAATSFLISVYGAFRFPSATFYLPHTRAWELLLGTILALDSCPTIRTPIMRQVAGIMGIFLIAGAVIFYTSSTPFPGLAAVPPCLGAALIISAGASGPNLVGRFLSLKPIVFIGLISYSLYLWHWPLIVFSKLGFSVLSGLDRHQSQALMFVVSLSLATLSWRFVELPFRSGALHVTRSALFRVTAIATVAVIAGSAALVASQGLPSRFTQQAEAVAVYLDRDPIDSRDHYRNGICFIFAESATLQDYSVHTCLPDSDKRMRFLVLGDSHAASMWWGFDQSLADVNVMQATAAGCKPVLNQRPRQRAGCTQIMNYALKEYLPSHSVDAVLIEAHWEQSDFAGIGETIDWLHQKGIPTILIGPIVQYDSPLPRLLAISINQNDPALPQRHLLSFVEPLDRQMATMSRDTWHVPYISLYDLFCGGGSCMKYAAPGVPVQYDYGHFTKAGSVLAAQRIVALGILPVNPVNLGEQRGIAEGIKVGSEPSGP